MRAVESLKVCTFMDSFCPAHIKFYMKKYRRAKSHETEKWCQVCGKADSWFQKWYEEFGEF